MKKILAILDKPNRPQAALKRVERIIRDANEEIECLPVSFLQSSVLDNTLLYDAPKRKALKKRQLEERKAWGDALRKQHKGLANIRVVDKSGIAEWVADHCDGIDLVVKTASGTKSARSATDWALLSSCPVDLLMVGHRRVKQPKVVVAAVDLAHKDPVHRKLNDRVLEAAAEFATMSGAELHLSHALEIPPAITDLDLVDPISAQRNARKRTKKQLEGVLKKYSIKPKHVHFPVGPIGEAMKNCAKSLHADLLVVGTRARPMREKLGLGNAAQRIVRKAPCDVLAIRP